MNKAVRDAVINLKAEWPAGYVMSVYVNDSEVCYGEFNTYVGLLASNMGRATQTYAEYKKEFEYMTTPTIDWNQTDYLFSLVNKDKAIIEFFEYKPSTSNCEECWMVNTSETLYLKSAWSLIERPVTPIKETKVNYKSETILDDNSIQYKISNIGNVLHNMSCSMGDENEQNEFGGYANFLWDLSKGYSAVTGGKATPQPKPAFTQEMSDNGELPSVGMECMIYNAELINPEYEKATIDFVGCHVIVYSSESCTERTCNLELVKFKPLIPPIELIDKGLYLFDVQNKKEMVGEAYFTEIGGCWMITNIRKNTSYQQSICTNIKPLTVDTSTK